MARHNTNLALLGEQLNRGIGRCGLLKPGIAERAGWVSPSIRRPSCSAAFVSSSGTTCAYRSVILKFLWPRCSLITFFGFHTDDTHKWYSRLTPRDRKYPADQPVNRGVVLSLQSAPFAET